VVRRWIIVGICVALAACGGESAGPPTSTVLPTSSTTPLLSTTTDPATTTVTKPATSTTASTATTTTNTVPSAPTGTIYFTADDGSRHGRSGVWSLDVDTGAIELLTQPGGVFEIHPRPSPDGTRIAYGTYDPTDDHNQFIWLIDPDGSNPIMVTDVPTQFWDWLPDGSGMLIGSYEGWSRNASLVADGDWALLDFATDEVTAIVDTVDREIRWFPQLAPDGSTIAFTSANGGDVAVWLYDVSTREESELAIGSLAAWSPDGAGIVLERDATIWLIGADGTDEHLLASEADVGLTSPTWSPDGQWIAFVRDDGITDEIWAIRPDGSDMRQLSWDSPIYLNDLSWGA